MGRDRDFPKPRILVSRCLGFAACRWNGQRIEDPTVEALKPLAEFIEVCPECDIGLGTPRHPARLVASEEGLKMIQPATGGDCTRRMLDFAKDFIEKAEAFDGAILKFKSPSCGVGNAKIYRGVESYECEGKGDGLFSGELKKRLPSLPMEDEGRLRNFAIRECFLSRVFLGATIRMTINNLGELMDFHARCKYLLMAYSQSCLKKMGRLLAEGEKAKFKELRESYASLFTQALAQPAKEGSVANALQHMMGHFSEGLNKAEKEYFIDLLEEYLRGSLPMSAPAGVLKAWALRFDERYILKQHLLRPYPEALVAISDSGKGRDF